MAYDYGDRRVSWDDSSSGEHYNFPNAYPRVGRLTVAQAKAATMDEVL